MEATTVLEVMQMCHDLIDNHGGDAKLETPIEIKPPTGRLDRCPVFINGIEQ